MVIGIDGGPTGGIVFLSRLAGLSPVWMAPMPTLKGGNGKTTLVDGSSAANMIRTMQGTKEMVDIFIEDLPHHSQSKAAMRSMALNFGRLVGALEARLPSERVRIRYVAAGNSLNGWQRAMLGKCPKGTTKDRALVVAKQFWPRQNWTLPGSRTPHNGLIDSALIAEYGRQQLI